jgi:hypothetical protein
MLDNTSNINLMNSSIRVINKVNKDDLNIIICSGNNSEL